MASCSPGASVVMRPAGSARPCNATQCINGLPCYVQPYIDSLPCYVQSNMLPCTEDLIKSKQLCRQTCSVVQDSKMSLAQ